LVATHGEGSLEEKAGENPNFHPKRRLALTWHRKAKTLNLGELGELHPALAAELGFEAPVGLAEISLDLFLTESKIPVKFQQVSPFPSVWRDLNLVVDESVTHGSLVAQIRANGGPFMRQVIFFDLYRGKPLEEGKKAMTFRIEYGSQERTLTDDEVNQAREQLTAKLKALSGAELR
jgi:phenylalanyl-tRNA synthetase beta chain